MAEIGSEFWTIESQNFDICFFVSGRTALDFIIRDILAERKINAVHMPSFCCHTMIEPFIKNKIPVVFYDVFFENGILTSSVPKVSENEIFFSVKYFGYEKQKHQILSDIKNSGCIVIEDTTHSWLLYNKKGDTASFADYSFTSFRKWTGFTGISVARKNCGKFVLPQKDSFHERYETLRRDAQEEKFLYMRDTTRDKQKFLEKFANAESLLEDDYLDYPPTVKSIASLLCLDKEKISSQRRENTKILLDELLNIKKITPVFSELGPYDVPLCVPVLVDGSLRNALRAHLTARKIYCPVHWPLSPMHNRISKKAKAIYSEELSLVCDQRYSPADMKQIALNVKNFFDTL